MNEAMHCSGIVLDPDHHKINSRPVQNIQSLNNAQTRQQRCCWMSLRFCSEWLILTTLVQCRADSVNIHLPSLTSPWSFTRMLAPWRQMRARQTSTHSTDTTTKTKYKVYPLHTHWSLTEPTQGGKLLHTYIHTVNFAIILQEYVQVEP